MNTSKRVRRGIRAGFARRLVSLALAAVTLWSLLPGLAPRAEAAEWMEPYLEKLAEWGVMRGSSSGDLNPDRMLTRAEFVTMINRAFGYTELGTTPFQDVPEDAWYADDINIAYQAGYFQGASETTAAPLGRVTREQAAVLLGRNLRLQGVPGVNSDFSDVQQMGNWSRGMVQECAELGIIQGYADGTFRPKNYITRGQMACFLVRALGTLVKDSGEQAAGGVYGNLTINSPGVKLRDTVVTGNLYLTGGVGLGNVELENVTVMGKIVVCGAGEAERGQNSIILRNVTADAMEIDSLKDHFMTVRTEGLTNIADTTVRTSAYLEDVTDDDQGLRVITLDGADGVQLQVAGNIKEVVNITPNSSLQVVQGITDKLTVDERATGSALSIANDTTVRVLNLDAGTPVTGNGDVSNMNINAAGSTVTMLPDTIFVRPGIESNVHGQVMDNIAAAESSDEPRLLSGYPLAKNLASTSADAVFSTNKRGTLYWAVSALLDGSVNADELRNPSAHPGKILRSGTINVTASKTEMTARVTGLTREGSYYISAMLVDERGHASPVKVTAFTTTDDSVPAFANGYPQAILTVDPDDDQEQIIQARVMTTKTCQLYYALLPQNSSAPTAASLRSGAVTGSLGYGVMEVSKNRSYLISRVNTAHLAEETTYDLYFWLNDADNGKSSAVRRVSVTTKDMTPPLVTNIYQSKSDRTSVQITYSMSERADLYWVIVKAGETLLRPAVTGDPLEPTDLAAKVQVEAGGGNAAVVNSGRTTASQADANYNFTISRLEEQGVYDLYYVAKDPAGNYSDSVLVLENVMTSDGEAPKVTVDFSRFNEGANGVINPWVESDVRLVFNEMVQGTYRDGSTDYNDNFLKLYEAVQESTGTALTQAKNNLAAALRKYIAFYPGTPPTSDNPRQDPVTDNNGTVPPEELEELTAWIDFREAVVTRTDGRITITFPGNKGIKMQSGGTYFFRIQDIVDASGNKIEPNPTYVPEKVGFTTAFATVRLTESQNEGEVEYPAGSDPRRAKIFQLSPEDTQAVPEDVRWDMFIWTDSSIDYQLLVRMAGDTAWFELGTARPSVTNVSGGKVYSSLNGNFNSQMVDSGLFGSVTKGQNRPFLYEFTEDLEFAIVPVENTLEKVVNMEVQLFAGGNTQFDGVSIQQGGKNTLDNANLTPIGEPDPLTLTVSPPDRAPTVSVPLGGIEVGDIAATVRVQIDRQPGTVYYMAVPVEKDADGNTPESGNAYTLFGPYPEIDGDVPDLETIPTRKQGAPDSEEYPMWLDADAPDPREVIRGVTGGDSSSIRVRAGNSGLIRDPFPQKMQIPDLDPSTTYILYLVTTDEHGTPSNQAMCLKFTTEPPTPPKIEIVHHSFTQAEIKVDKPSTVDYVLVNTRSLSATAFGTTFSTLLPAGTTLPSNFPAGGTVLDAMIYEYNVNNVFMGSIFDNFADTATKATYAEMIRQSESMEGTADATPASPQTIQSTTRGINFTGMQGRDNYALLVVGRGENSETDGFRASRYYRNPNAEYLYVLSCSLGANQSADKADNYSGTLSIVFSGNLYYNPEMLEEFPEVDSCEKLDGNHTPDNIVTGDNGKQYINIGTPMSLGPCTTGMTSPTPGTGHAASNVGNSLTFGVTGGTNNTTLVTFIQGLCGSNGAVRNGDGNASLVVKLKRVVSGDTVSWDVEYTDAWHRAGD